MPQRYLCPSDRGPRVRTVRLRTLSEAECYARCYGGHSDERVSVVRLAPRGTQRSTGAGDRLRELFEERLDARPDPEAEAA
jgi:hypothetical protein